jgi:type I restriction enzyme R subunit
LVEELKEKYPDFGVPIGETAQREFVNLFNQIMRLRNILVSFDDFEAQDSLSPADQQDYRSKYLETKDELLTVRDGDRESIIQDLIFELELIKQIEINVDYILNLIRQLQDSGVDLAADKEIKATISRAVDSSIELRSKKDLIERFISRVNLQGGVSVDTAWSQFIGEERNSELEQIIEEEKLQGAATRVFMDQAFRSGEIQTAGTALARIIPPVSMFTGSGEHEMLRARVISKLQNFFERFFTLGT